MPYILGRRRSEDVQISRTEDECVEHLSDERHAFARQQRPETHAASSPSALLFEWIAHISMSFDDVCETSPRIWKRLNPILGTKGRVRRLHSNRLAACCRRVRVQIVVSAPCARAILGIDGWRSEDGLTRFVARFGSSRWKQQRSGAITWMVMRF